MIGVGYSPLKPTKGGRRRVIHEFHSLCPVILFPEGNPRARWQPKSGAVLKAVPGAPKAAESRPQRLFQMKSLAREFSAYSITPARFSDYSLYLLHKNRQVWAAVRGPKDTLQSDAQHLYNGRIDRFIPEIERDR